MLGFTSNGGFPSWTEIPWEGPKELNPNLHKSQVFPKKFKHDLKRIQHELIALQFCWPKPPSVFVCMLYKMPGCHGLTPATTRHNGSVHVDWTLKQLRWHLLNQYSCSSASAGQARKHRSLKFSQIFRFHKSSAFVGPAKFLTWLPESCSRANLRRLEPTSTSFSLQSAVTSCAFHDRDAQRPKAETTYHSFYRGHRSASTAAFTLEGLFQRLTKLMKMIPKFPDLKKGGSTVLKAFRTSHFDRCLCVVALPISPHGIRHVRWCIRNGFLPSLSRHKGAKGH